MSNPIQDSQIYTTEAGLVTDQAHAGRGLPGTVIDGANVFFEEGSKNRVFAGLDDKSESVSPTSALAYTVNVTAGLPTVTGNMGAAFLTDFSPYCHVLIGRRLYVVQTIASNTSMTVSPVIDSGQSSAAAVIAQCPNLHALVSDRGSLTAGSAVKWREEILLVAGRGRLKVNGANTSATLDASSTPQIAYPDPASPGTYVVANAGFTKPAVPAVVGAAGGTKNMPATSYSIRVARGRKGFPGIGPFSEAVEFALTAGQLARITLAAFDATQGQSKWVVAATKSNLTGAGLQTRGPWFLMGDGSNETFLSSTTFDFEWRDSELVEQIEFTNDPPPPALFAFTFNDRAYVASCYGDPDSSGEPTAPGPAVAASKPNNVEAYAADATALINPSEPIVGVLAGSQRVFALSTNHLSVGSLTGSQATPLAFRAGISAGFFHQYNACLAEEVLYYLTGDGLARTAGNEGERGDFRFSKGVKSLIHQFVNQRSFLGYDPRNLQVVVFASNYQLSTGGYWQTAALSYNVLTNTFNVLAILGDGECGTTASEDFTVTGVVTIESELWLVTSTGRTYIWDAGDNDISGFLAWPFSDFGVRGRRKTARVVHVVGNAGNAVGAVRLYRNLDTAGLSAGTGGVARPFADGGTGVSVKQRVWKPNYSGDSLAPRVAFTNLEGRDPVIEGVEMEVEITMGRRS